MLEKRAVATITIDAGPQEGEETVMVGNELYLPRRIEGNRVSFLVDTGSGVSILAAQTWRKWGRAEDELTRYWGRLYSVEGRALECLGRTRLTVTLGTRAIKWNFIVAEMGDDERILGNDFAMAHKLTVRPCEGAVYLPNLSREKEEHMGQRLPCTICSVTEVRAIMEETLAVRAVGQATLAAHTIIQVRVVVPTPRLRGTVMIETGPGPLGLCSVRGVVKVEQDSRIWLANTGPQPIRIEETEVVAIAECVIAGPGASPGDDRNEGDEVNGLVERAAPHLTDRECGSCGQLWGHAGTCSQQRFCIDYRRLNQVTKVDAYPLPHIEDSLNTLGGARFFCSLDLASRYWQVKMDAAEWEKTAFVTQGGRYEFRVMPFGLVNAPATFERLMERVL